MRSFTVVLSVILCGLLVVNGLILWATFPTGRVVAIWKQPLSVDKERVQYEMHLIEQERRIYFGPFDRAYELRVHRVGNPGYGHSIAVSLFGKAISQACRDTCFVEWTALGVEFTQASGHRSFIPTSAYVGGR